MKRDELIDKAKELINGERKKDYGDARRCFALTASLWGIYLNREVYADDVAVMMMLLKIARMTTGKGTDDCWIDIIGYAALGGELKERRNEEI